MFLKVTYVKEVTENCLGRSFLLRGKSSLSPIYLPLGIILNQETAEMHPPAQSGYRGRCSGSSSKDRRKASWVPHLSWVGRAVLAIFLMVKTLEIYLFSEFQLYTTLLLALFTMLYLRPLELIYLITKITL